MITPGSTYDGEFDTTNPLAWGFDKGGFLYRDQEINNAIFAPASLAGGTGTGNTIVPAATAPIRYKVGGKSYGYEQNSVGAGQARRPARRGRPAVRRRPRVPVRRRPVLPGVERVRRAPGAQRAAVPDGRADPGRSAGRRAPAPAPARPARGARRGQGGVPGGAGTDGAIRSRPRSCRSSSTARSATTTVPGRRPDHRRKFDNKALRTAVAAQRWPSGHEAGALHDHDATRSRS